MKRISALTFLVAIMVGAPALGAQADCWTTKVKIVNGEPECTTDPDGFCTVCPPVE